MGVKVPLEGIDDGTVDGAKVVLEAADETLLIILFEGCSLAKSSRLRFLVHGPTSLVGVLTAEECAMVEGTIVDIDRG